MADGFPILARRVLLVVAAAAAGQLLHPPAPATATAIGAPPSVQKLAAFNSRGAVDLSRSTGVVAVLGRARQSTSNPLFGEDSRRRDDILLPPAPPGPSHIHTHIHTYTPTHTATHTHTHPHPPSL